MVDGFVTSYLLDNLLENTDYIVRIIARNREGEGFPLTSEAISALKPSSEYLSASSSKTYIPEEFNRTMSVNRLPYRAHFRCLI